MLAHTQSNNKCLVKTSPWQDSPLPYLGKELASFYYYFYYLYVIAVPTQGAQQRIKVRFGYFLFSFSKLCCGEHRCVFELCEGWGEGSQPQLHNRRWCRNLGIFQFHLLLPTRALPKPGALTSPQTLKVMLRWGR